MIYIIIGTDTTTHNEWVMNDTFDNSLDAANRCQELNSVPTVGGEAVYRVDTVEPSEGKSAARLYADKQVDMRETKFRLSAEYGQNKMDHEEQHYAYRDTDSMRTKDFQLTELFGWFDGVKSAERLINCFECGAVVSYDNEMMEKHRTWHNKLLP